MSNINPNDAPQTTDEHPEVAPLLADWTDYGVAKLRLRGSTDVHSLEGWRFDPSLLQAACCSILGQSIEPDAASSGYVWWLIHTSMTSV